MTNSLYIGEALTLKCHGQHSQIELTGGGRTRRSDVYPDTLCRAILTGLVNQMKVDDRIGSSFKSCDQAVTNEEEERYMEVNEVNWDKDVNENTETIAWSRKDFGTTRLMLPGEQGPLWSSRA